jgi:hypothetical protein
MVQLNTFFFKPKQKIKIHMNTKIVQNILNPVWILVSSISVRFFLIKKKM